MVAKRLIPALVLSHALAIAAFAQSSEVVPPSSEFGRASAGEISAITKHPGTLSGSFSLSASKSQMPFGGNGRGLDATLGGTLVQDRVWFFASAQHDTSFFSPQLDYAAPAAEMPSSRAINSKVTASIGDRQSLAASFASSRNATSTTAGPLSLPSSFMTMHYTALVSDNMSFTATLSQSKTTQPSVFGTTNP